MAGTAGVVLGLVAWVRHLERAGALRWEAGWLTDFATVGPGFANAVWLDAPGSWVMLIPLVTAGAILAVRRNAPIRALTLLLSFFGVDLVIGAGWLAWSRPRPDVIAGGIAAPGLQSFPSGHMGQAMAVYGMLAFLWIRATPAWGERAMAAGVMLMVVGAVAAARLRMGAHWPTDVLAGILIGALWAACLALALRDAEARGGR